MTISPEAFCPLSAKLIGYTAYLNVNLNKAFFLPLCSLCSLGSGGYRNIYTILQHTSKGVLFSVAFYEKLNRSILGFKLSISTVRMEGRRSENQKKGEAFGVGGPSLAPSLALDAVTRQPLAFSTAAGKPLPRPHC